ncbi:MAG: hypothetical protein WDO74_05230 [Pseudomonadota bacterium]
MIEPTLAELASATNIVWTLICGFLALFMQAALRSSKPGYAGRRTPRT